MSNLIKNPIGLNGLLRTTVAYYTQINYSVVYYLTLAAAHVASKYMKTLNIDTYPSPARPCRNTTYKIIKKKC